MKRFLAVCLTTGVTASAAPITGVPANTKADGYAPASQLSREWRQHQVAQGAMPVENPGGIVGWYGDENDSPSPTDPSQPQMLPTPENPAAPTYAATLSVPTQVEDVSGALGRGGCEGIQNDNDGNIWIVEDIGGTDDDHDDR